MKVSLTDNDLMVQADFAESYKNDLQDAIQNTYFGNQGFSIFTACCYFKVTNNNVIDGKNTNSNAIVVTERPDHDRAASMSCLEKVVAEIKSKHGKFYENLYVWSDGMGTQFRSRFVFKLLAGTILQNKSLMWLYNELHHGKGPMDAVGKTVKSVVFRKVKFGQVVINSSQEFSEAVKSFVPSINAVYLPKSESIIEPKNIECTKKINDTLKVYKLERKDNANGNLYIIFFKIADDDKVFNVQWYDGENDIICGHDKSSKSDDQCAKCDGLYKEE